MESQKRPMILIPTAPKHFFAFSKLIISSTTLQAKLRRDRQITFLMSFLKGIFTSKLRNMLILLQKAKIKAGKCARKINIVEYLGIIFLIEHQYIAEKFERKLSSLSWQSINVILVLSYYRNLFLASNYRSHIQLYLPPERPTLRSGRGVEIFA